MRPPGVTGAGIFMICAGPALLRAPHHGVSLARGDSGEDLMNALIRQRIYEKEHLLPFRPFLPPRPPPAVGR